MRRDAAAPHRHGPPRRPPLPSSLLPLLSRRIRSLTNAQAIRPVAPLPEPLDELGLVPRFRRLSLDAVDPRFAPLLDAIRDASLAAASASGAAEGGGDGRGGQQQQQRLLGVYLRGSVPRGLFIEGVSDVDAVALVVVGGGGGGGVGGGGPASTAAAQQTLAERLASSSEARAAMAELRPTKVDLRVHCVPPREAAALLREATEVALQPGSSFLPPSLVRRALGPTLAFELATSAVALLACDGNGSGSGNGLPTTTLDLPALLPDVARLPPAPWLLPTIAADVGRAVRAMQKEDLVGDEQDAAPRSSAAAAARWALKRCVRAALELQFVSQAGGGRGGARGGPARPHRPLRWTRDLYHCAALTRAAADSPQGDGCRLSARVADAVDEALRLYVGLLLLPPREEGGGGGGEARAAGEHALRLADALDAAFLAAMLGEAPGWLTRHVPLSSSRPDSGGRRASWLPPPLARLLLGGGGDSGTEKIAATSDAAADNIAAPGQPPLLLVGCDPPPVHVRISGPPRLQYDWWGPPRDNDGQRRGEKQQEQQQEQQHDPREGASAALAAAVTGASSTSTREPQPVLLRGFAKRWPATRRWSFAALLLGGDNELLLRGKARAAPSLAFPFCEPALRDVLVAARGPAAAPSLEIDDLSASDFVRAMLLRQQKQKEQHLAPASHPYLYLQAELPEGHPMHDDVREGLDELRALLRAGQGGAGAAAVAPPPTVRVAQRPRLWASARGSVSPTHYDADASVLVQVVGRKRMLLFHPDQLQCLSPYPEQHLLRRRARVNLADAAAAADGAALRSRLEAVEVVLEPGDAVFFPAEWAHYTESLTPSMSVTTRFAVAAGEGR